MLLAVSTFLTFFVMAAVSSFAQIPNKSTSRQIRFLPTASNPRYALLNINNLTTWMRADGQSNHSPTGDNGTHFPRGTANVIYQDGIIWGGKAYLDTAKTRPAPFTQLRIGGATYHTSMRQGRILGFGENAVPANPKVAESRIYRIRRDYFFMSDTELRKDAAEFYEIPPEAITSQSESIREQYHRDWLEWPVQFGAPFIDRNRNGRYDPHPPFSTNFTPNDLIAGRYDEPGVSDATPDSPADQVLWTVCNDLDRNVALSAFGSEPLGLEAQITLWGYQSAGALAGTFFRRIRLINKGGVDIDTKGTKGGFWMDSVYVGQWSDPDLGYFADDLAGCDTLLNLGYAYNATNSDEEFQKHDLKSPPAVGYVLLQGPRVPSFSDSAFYDFKRIYHWKNLRMTAFSYFLPSFGEPPINQSIPFYKRLRGYGPNFGPDRYLPFPPDMAPGPFPLSGDPVKAKGFIDGRGTDYSPLPADRRLMISSGPFTLAPGDTQEVVYAFVAALAADRLSSITLLKFFIKQIRLWYPYQGNFARGQGYQPAAEPEPPQYFTLSPNYPNPFTSLTFLDYTIIRSAEVRLSIHDVLGREVAVLAAGRAEPGFYHAVWDGRDQRGDKVAHGIYFCRLRVNDQTVLREKLVLIR